MKKLIKIAAVLAVIGILAAIYVWFFVYNKPHRNYETAKVDFTLPAQMCYNQYANGADEANQYIDKVLQIDGIPSSIESTDSTVIIVFAYNSGMFGDEGVRCSVLPDYQDKAKKLKLDKRVVVKGYCAGYNGTDVILEYCSLITQ
jgi:type II secretory pathway pseudopilin PulG